MTPLGSDALESDVAGSRSLDFAVLGDCQPPLARMPFSNVTHAIMRELRLLRPRFVLYVGDRIWGFGETPQQMLNTYDRFSALAATTGVPFYAVPGNHECQSDPAAIELLESFGRPSYGSFDVGRYHFVGLNTEEFCLEGRVTGEQLAWLEADLESSRESDGIVVFMHRPLFSWFQGDFNPDDAAGLQELFRSYPVRAVFAGHDHFYAEEEHDGVRYFTVGGGGGTLYAQPPRGGYSHYLLVRPKGDAFDVDVIDPGRLQVDYVAGNDGLEPVTRARVINTTERSLVVRNLELRLPRLSAPELYRLSTDYVEFDGTWVEIAASVPEIADNGDGSVTLSVEVPVPDGSAFYVTAEAREIPTA
jgi:3',5'-cyclic AMP phosphodiesterase CpdA